MSGNRGKPLSTAGDIAGHYAALGREAQTFADLTGTLYALRFTGTITLHFLNGQPQLATLGQPLELRFSEHPANKPLDSTPACAPSSERVASR